MALLSNPILAGLDFERERFVVGKDSSLSRRQSSRSVLSAGPHDSSASTTDPISCKINQFINYRAATSNYIVAFSCKYFLKCI